MKVYKFNEQPVNEELLGGLINFFKNLWKKAAAEIAKMDNDPNRIKDYIVNNTLNPDSNNSIFKNEFDNFKKNAKNLNDTTVLNFVNEILNPTTGVLGKQGIGNLFNDPALKGDKMKAKRIAFEYIINTARDYVIKKIKYNPKDNKFNRDATSGKFLDLNLLGGLKAQMPDPKKLDLNKITGWINVNIFKDMQNYVKSIREDDIKAAIEKGGATTANAGEMTYDTLKDLFDAGTPVIYLLKGKTKDQYDPKKTPEEQTEVVGVKKINSLNDQDKEDSVVFLDKDGQPSIKKSYDEIIGAAKAGAGNEQKAKDALGKIKGDDEKMGKVAKFADFLANATPEQQAELDKIIGK